MERQPLQRGICPARFGFCSEPAACRDVRCRDPHAVGRTRRKHARPRRPTAQGQPETQLPRGEPHLANGSDARRNSVRQLLARRLPLFPSRSEQPAPPASPLPRQCDRQHPTEFDAGTAMARGQTFCAGCALRLFASPQPDGHRRLPAQPPERRAHHLRRRLPPPRPAARGHRRLAPPRSRK